MKRGDEVVLAIDQGTTGTTALLVDRAGAVRGRGYAELPQHFPHPGWVEHDGVEIWESVLVAVHRCLRAGRLPASRIRAIGITNQRETALVWDRLRGRPVGRAIVWQDRRSAAICAALRRKGLEPQFRKRTGLVLDPYFSGTKLTWLLRERRALRAPARRGELAFGTVDSWLVWKLSGGRAHVTDPTNASRTLLYDIRRREWDAGLCDHLEVPVALLPRVLPSSGEFARTHGVPGLPGGIPVAGIAGDQQAALFGQGCDRPGTSKNTYGTGCFLLLHTGSRPVPSRHGLLTTVACGPRGEPAYALEGSVFIAGAAIQWLRDGLRILAQAGETAALARSVADSGGVVMVPAFVGLGAPYWRPDVRGALLGLTRGTTRAHVARAALEAIAFQTRDVVEAMEADSRSRLRLLRVDGGAAANDFLMQFQADLLGVPVVRPRVVETTALGAAQLAGLATGIWDGPRDLVRARRTERVFRPRWNRTRRESEYQRWKWAVTTLLGGRGRRG
jgi:glycerol kinase